MLTFNLSYFSFSTIVSSADLVGSLGSAFAILNHKFFGYLSFAYPFALLVALFLWFKHPGFSLRRVELFLSSVLLFFTLVIFQALLVSNELRGSLGGNFVDFLSPYIGGAGVWIFWVMSTMLGTSILLDKSIHDMLDIFPKINFSINYLKT